MTQRDCIVYICDFCSEYADNMGGHPAGWGMFQVDGHEDYDVCPDCVDLCWEVKSERKRNAKNGGESPPPA